MICCQKTRTKYIFVLPNGFRGKVTIYFEDQMGVDVTKENYKLFIIPETGILAVKNKIEIGWAGDEFYFQGSKMPIPVDFVGHYDPTSIRVFGYSEFGYKNNFNNEHQLRRSEKVGIEFFVGTKADSENGFAPRPRGGSGPGAALR